MGFSIPHLLLLLIVIFVVFGAGKLPKVMGDIGRGIKNLREGLNGDAAKAPADTAVVIQNPDDKPSS